MVELLIRYDLANELGKITHNQTIAIADYRNGDLSLVRLRAMINRVHRDMIIQVDKTHERTKDAYAQTHTGTDAPKNRGAKKKRSGEKTD